MQYTIFPKSENKVSKLGYGAMGLAGWFENTSKKDMIRSVINALEKGVNFIDTARAYGQSEAILKEALTQWKGEKPFLASKVESLGPDNTRWGIPQDVNITFPKGHIRKSAETSLQTLGVEQLDLLQLHLYWPNWGVSGYWMDDLQALKEEGKIRFIGVSNPDCRCDVVLPLVMSGLIDSVQTIFNIFDPLPLDCLVPIAQKNNVAVIARCILDEGGLSGFLQEETQFSKDDFRQTFFDSIPRSMYINRVNALRAFVPQYASSLTALAIKYAIHHPGITTALTSMHIEKFANENIAAVDEAPLPEKVFEEIRRHHRWIRNFYDSKYWDKEAVGGSLSK